MKPEFDMNRFVGLSLGGVALGSALGCWFGDRGTLVGAILGLAASFALFLYSPDKTS